LPLDAGAADGLRSRPNSAATFLRTERTRGRTAKFLLKSQAIWAWLADTVVINATLKDDQGASRAGAPGGEPD
jgi:hypothetical protein